MVYFFFKRLCACKCFPHSRSLNNQQQKVEQVSTAYGAQTHTRPETNPSLGALDSLPDFRESDGSSQSARFPHVTFSVSLSPHVSSLFPIFPIYPSDVRERDLVELVLEVSVSQVSQRQRDMLLRQVGVLLGVLDSDIIVREISAFNEHR